MGEIIHLNGRLLSAGEAGIDPSDQGFLYGAGLFETMRAYSGCIFLLDRHINRLLSSAQAIGVENIEAAKLDEACRSVVAANGLHNARVRLTVSRGKSKLFPAAWGQPTVLAQAQPFMPPPPEKYRLGYRTKVSRVRRYSGSPLVRHKTTSYLECLLARTQVEAESYDEAMFLNERGNLAEGSTSNLFLVSSNETLRTPPLGAGLLPGITRQFVLEIAGKLGMEAVEKDICPEGLVDFHEAFVTSSLIEIMPLASITDENGREYSFKVGEATEMLRRAYQEAIETAAGKE